jgi:PAS domain S-box-containing protein
MDNYSKINFSNDNGAVLFFNLCNDLALVFDKKGEILFANKAFISFTGEDFSILKNKPVSLLFAAGLPFSGIEELNEEVNLQIPLTFRSQDQATMFDVTISSCSWEGEPAFLLIGNHRKDALLSSYASDKNVSELQDYKLKLEHQLDQQTLIADISQQLSSVDFYQSLDKLLEVLGKHTKVSRVYIFEDSEDGDFTSNTFEWCNEGIVPQINDLKNIPWEIIPSWKMMLWRDGRIFSQNIQELPEDIYSVLEPQQIKSLLIFPIISHQDMIGFIGFDECLANRHWERDEIDLLKLISNMLSSAFERSHMMRRIKENETRLELAISNSREGVWDWNMISDKVFLSEAWYNLFGYKEDEILPEFAAIEKLIHPDDRKGRSEQWQKHIQGELDYYEFTLRMLTKTGDWKWILEKGKVISQAPDGSLVRAIGKHSDVTEIKMAEERLMIALDKEKELNDLKSRFVSNSSHEFRTPLASILITSDSLRQYWNKMSPDQIENRLGSIQERVHYLTRIVNDILEISRLKDGQSGIRLEEFDLVALCKSLLEVYKTENRDMGRICCEYSPASITVNADKKLMTQIVNNLVSNALKYSNKDQRINISLHIEMDILKFSIVDQGIGIPVKEQKHLFEPFFRASNSELVAGSGLGLSIVKESVARHGGEIIFKSNPGQGTRFDILFPSKLLVENVQA